MEMKDIALMLCNLPAGKYSVETKLGVIDINTVWSNDENLRIIEILINGKIYDTLTYAYKDNSIIYEKINFENNGKPYKSTHGLFNGLLNVITYQKDSEHEYEITPTRITKKSKDTNTYAIENGICISQHKNIKFTYDFKTDEKLLYIKKFNCKKNLPILEVDYICINKEYNYEDIIWHYNSFIKSYQEKVKKHTGPIQELISCIPFTTIDIKEVRRLDKEIDEYIEIYKEFAPKLNQYHSEEMLEVLESVAVKLHADYIKSKQEQPKKKEKKFFNISKFKNN